MSKGKVVILGFNGHIGRVVAEAFVGTGWDVSGMARTDRLRLPGVRFVAGNADSVDDLRRAIGEAGVVVNALNLPYPDWDHGRLEAQMGRVLEALGNSGRTMLFPGNVYNFSAGDRIMTPDTPQHPQTPRGAIRVRVERMVEAAAARGDIQAIILRAGDFYGPDSANDWFDLAICRSIARGRVDVLGTPGVGHAWAYLPDLARAFEALAALRGSLGGFERFHFAGHYVTPEQMASAITGAAPGRLSVGAFAHWTVPLMGLFSAQMREIGKMGYLWRNPMELRDPRLADLLGPGFGTPFETAIAATMRPFLARSAGPARLVERAT